LGNDYTRTGGNISAYINKKEKAGGAILAGISENGGVYFSGEAAGKFPCGFSGNLGFSRIPYKWGLDVNYDDLTKTLPTETVIGDLVTGLSWERPGYPKMTISANRKTFDTPGGTGKKHTDHFQVWDAGIKGWKFAAEYSFPKNIVLDGYMGLDDIDGSLRLLYEGEQYLQGFFDGESNRFGAGIGLKEKSPAIPRIRFDRVFTNIDLTKGVGDSWPFTPKQIEVFGDMKWTFEGNGRIVSNSVTAVWQNLTLPDISAGLARVYIDYKLKTVKREFTGDPMELIFGMYSEDKDRIGYYDAVSLTMRKIMAFRTFSLHMGLGETIPVKYSRETEKGSVSEEPSFKVKKIKMRYFGGFYADLSLRKYF